MLVGMSRNEDNFMREARDQCSGSCRSGEVAVDRARETVPVMAWLEVQQGC